MGSFVMGYSQERFLCRRNALLMGTALASIALIALSGPAGAGGGDGGRSASSLAEGGDGGHGPDSGSGQNGDTYDNQGGGGGGAGGGMRGGGNGGNGGNGGAGDGGPGGDGGAGGQEGAPNGINGSPGPTTNSGGGGGGGGRHGYFFNDPGTVGYTNLGGVATAGDGGSGGTGNGYGGGGGGGEGGYYIYFAVPGTVTNRDGGSIGGGQGGNGGSASFGDGGRGGAGGIGVFFGSPGSTLINDAEISGGNGGAGGTSNSGTAAAGAGGAGVVGSGISIINGGTIKGGTSGDGTSQANAVTFTGGENTITFKNATDGLDGNIGVTGNVTLDNTVTSTEVDSIITGTGSVTKAGDNTIVLSGNNTYSGGTYFNAGTLSVKSDSNLGNTAGALTFNGGILQVTGNTFGSTSRNINWGSGGGGFDIADEDHTFTVTQSLGGLGGLTKLGLGTLILSGTNTYTGGTTIDDGVLQLGSIGITGSIVGAVTVGSYSFFDIVNANTSGITSIANDGSTVFFNSTNAGTATIINNDTLAFVDNSSAANATITNHLYLEFSDASTAGNANITNNGYLNFYDTSTAGTANITNDGVMIVVNNASTANATITNNYFLEFYNASTAGNAKITNNGFLAFSDTSTAGNATIVTAANAETAFGYNADGGNARFITEAGGFVDFSATTGPKGDGQISAGSIAGAGTYIIGGGNTLTVGGNNDSTEVSGEIWNDCGCYPGDGALVKIGTGTLTLSGNNTYRGGTTLAGGKISVSSEANLGDVAGSLTFDGGILQVTGTTFDSTMRNIIWGANGGGFDIVEPTHTFTVAQTLTGSGGLTKEGAGTLVLSGTNTYTGATNVNAGTLLVNGSIESSLLTTVNSGAILGGDGILGNTWIGSGGTLSPGNSIGQITVNGNLTFQAGSNYLVEVNPDQADRTDVTGTATLAGTVTAQFASGTYLARNYTILSAQGGLSGTFDAITTNLSSNFTAQLGYDTNDVWLRLSAQLGAGLGTITVNQHNVATALNDYFNNGGTLPPQFVTLFGLTGDALRNALNQTSGESGASISPATFMAWNSLFNMIFDPYAQNRGGFGSGFGANAFAAEGSQSEDVRLAYAAVTPKRDLKDAPLVTKAPPLADSFASRWSVWGGGYGGTAKTDGNAQIGSHDTTSRAYGFAAGADHRVTPNTVIGFALAGGGTSFGLDQGLGGGTSDLFQASVYGRHHWGAGYVMGALGYGWQDVTLNRT